MELLIDKSKKLSIIQDEFHTRFPNLKIEFYSVPHSTTEGSTNSNILNPDHTIGEVQEKESNGLIHISGLMTVAELEQSFSDVYGLSVQVFRKSGNVWLQTIRTDNWTLAEQNHKGGTKPENIEEIIDAKDRMELE